MPRKISSWSKRYIRRSAEIHMTSTVRIVRPAVLPAPDGNGIITIPNEMLGLYEGPARIYEVLPSGDTNMGDITYSNRSTTFSVPASTTAPDIDDIIKVLTCPEDSDLVGRAFRITGVSGGGQTMATRRLSASVLDESNAWQ